MSHDTKLALAVLAEATQLTAAEISNLAAICARQMDLIKNLEKESAQRAVVLGLTLWRVRFALHHGQWIPWQKQHLPLGQTQVHYYMRLAAVFLARGRATKLELKALPADVMALDHADAITRTFKLKLEKFVGELSLNELLVKHGIKGVARDADDDGQRAVPAGKVGEQMLLSEFTDHLFGLSKIDNRVLFASTPPAQVDALKREADAWHRKFTADYEEARGKKQLSRK